ncbi:MAG: hypothetical protein LBN34_07140 [Clostridiales Family XIII bacterium]|jgi:hypothetical protein|nr:hypothetical protein [Clostridiales Family XIII bacterium]
MKKKGTVIIPHNHPNPPEPHEIEAAQIIADNYSCVIEFIIPIDDYKRKTPDVWMNSVRCEMKSPVGNSKKNTVRKQFERASAQHAKHLIFDGRRSKLTDDYIQKEIHRELAHRRRVKKVFFITKDNFVVEFEK